jgi:acyl-CoA synthetase (AMP-forming)/AMP-acid ligase II
MMTSAEPEVSDYTVDTAPTVATLIAARAAATPDAVMLIDEHDRQLSFAEYAAAVDQTARKLMAIGVSPGATVAWQLPTRIESIVLMGALARLDVLQVPILPIHREKELRFALRQTGASYLCVPNTWRGTGYAALAESVRQELNSFQTIICDPEPQGGATQPDSNGLPPLSVRNDIVRYVYFTSGTTSDPKGAMHVDRAAVASGRAFIRSQGFRPDDRYGVAFPFTHIGGLTNLTGVLFGGYTLMIMETFSGDQAVDVFGRHGATIVGGGTAFYLAYLEVQRRNPQRPIFPKLRFMTGGAAPMPPSLHFQVRDEIGGRGCCHGYAMTESCSMVAMNHPDDTDEHLSHTVGRILDGLDARVVLSDGQQAKPGEEGELRLKGNWMFVGYLDSTLDASAFDSDGFFRTGDLASIDAEGYLRITGRIKDIIIRKGENISAKEVEDILFTHPAVADAGVIGLPDDERGELVCAVITVSAESEPPTLAGLREFFIDAGVMLQKIPEQLEIVDHLPRNAAGKVEKKDLIARFSERSGAAS